MKRKTLPFLKLQTIDKKSWVVYILSVRIEDYWKFVSDDTGHLLRCLFDSDGWDYLLAKQVNKQIAQALADPAESWLLNNGVTIIVSNATVQGNTMQLQDVQIIDGLQMSKIICHHFQDGSATSKDENLFVQIIVTSDAQTRAQIIEATSHQGQPVTSDDLRAINNARKSVN